MPYFAHWCYRKSGSDLDAAMRRQRQATNAIGHKLEHKDQVELVFDAAGNVIGNSITVSLSPLASSAALGTPTVTITTGEPPQFDRQHEQPPSPEPEGDHA